MFNVSAILINDTRQRTFPLSDVVINDAPWSVVLRHSSSTIACFNSVVEIPNVVDSLLQWPSNGVIHPI